MQVKFPVTLEDTTTRTTRLHAMIVMNQELTVIIHRNGEYLLKTIDLETILHAVAIHEVIGRYADTWVRGVTIIEHYTWKDLGSSIVTTLVCLVRITDLVGIVYLVTITILLEMPVTISILFTRTKAIDGSILSHAMVSSNLDATLVDLNHFAWQCAVLHLHLARYVRSLNVVDSEVDGVGICSFCSFCLKFDSSLTRLWQVRLIVLCTRVVSLVNKLKHDVGIILVSLAGE